MSEIFGVLTYNCKGLRDETKREKIFNYIRDCNKVGISFLQETHSALRDQQRWEAQWGRKENIFLNHGHSNARGNAILFHRLDFEVFRYVDDGNGRLQIMSVKLAEFDSKILLINIYNENKEKDQLKLLEKLNEMLGTFGDVSDHVVILGGDFNFIFDKVLDSSGASGKLNVKSIAMITSIIEKFDLVDIFRIRNPAARKFSFCQGNSRILKRLDFFLISNILQESVDKTKVLTALSSDHSSVIVTFKETAESEKGRSYWKFNTTLLHDTTYDSSLREAFAGWRRQYADQKKQLHWDLLKYEIRKFSTKYSKDKAKARREEVKKLEKLISDYENTAIQNPSAATEDYSVAKQRFEEINDEKAVGSILRSRCTWYEDGEKSSKFFLNCEKNNAVKSSIRAIIDENNVELHDKKQIMDRIHRFYSDLFSKKVSNSKEVNMSFLESLDLPKLSEEQKDFCEIEFTKDDLFETLTTMQGGKSPGNDGLGKEFYFQYWDIVGDAMFDSFMEAKSEGTLSPSQRQALLKLIAKKDSDKRHIGNWRPISLLNVDTKILSKTIASKLKCVLPTLVTSDQTAYVPGRFIGESCRLISDVIEIADKLKLDGWLVTMDIQKAFDSVDHDFLFCVLENAGFGSSFINWITILVKNQMSCVTNSGTTSSYFELLRGCRQGDPISAYLFILVIEVFFHMVRTNRHIEGLNILNFEYKLTAYADDSSFFLKNENSVLELLKTFDLFSKYSGLMLNRGKCELAGIGAKKDVIGESVPGLKKINLCEDSIKILGLHYSYKREILIEKNYVTVVKKISKVLAMWKWRNLSLAGKVTVFKSLAISKIVYIAFLSTVPKSILTKLEEIQKDFLWGDKRPKVAQKTLIASYEDGGLKSVDIVAKIQALRLSWISRLYAGSPHPWKHIPTQLLENPPDNPPPS